MNSVQVFVPYKSDVQNKTNVGYFVNDVILKQSRNSLMYYRPAVDRKALATDYVVEHYKFINDQLPENILKSIESDPVFQESDEHEIALENTDMLPESFYQVNYSLNEEKGSCVINLSLRLLFYITAAILYEEYKDILKNKKDADFKTAFDFTAIESSVKEALINYIAVKARRDMGVPCIEVKTVLKYKLSDIIYHIVKFVHVYSIYSDYKSRHLIEKPVLHILEHITLKNHPYTLFGIGKEEITLMENIRREPDLYFEHLVIRKNKKKRDLYKYRSSKEGEAARALHKKVCAAVSRNYQVSDCSYAYKKGGSIKDCAARHLDSRSFFKYDISKFFNSIRLDRLKEALASQLEIDRRYDSELELILETCFYDKVLPLGLAASPILSDIYMHSFDAAAAELEEKGYVYTRYADDIMLSSQRQCSAGEKEAMDQWITEALHKKELTPNMKKKMEKELNCQGDHIRYLGISIVRGADENYLSVGRTYINDIAREYLKYCEDRDALKTQDFTDEESRKKAEESLFYTARYIAGKVGFLKQIEGRQGFERLLERLGKYDSVEVEEDRLVL